MSVLKQWAGQTDKNSDPSVPERNDTLPARHSSGGSYTFWVVKQGRNAGHTDRNAHADAHTDTHRKNLSVNKNPH